MHSPSPHFALPSQATAKPISDAIWEEVESLGSAREAEIGIENGNESENDDADDAEVPHDSGVVIGAHENLRKIFDEEAELGSVRQYVTTPRNEQERMSEEPKLLSSVSMAAALENDAGA